MSLLEIIFKIPNVQIQSPSLSRVEAFSEASVSPDYISLLLGWSPTGKLPVPRVKNSLGRFRIHFAISMLLPIQIATSSARCE